MYIHQSHFAFIAYHCHALLYTQVPISFAFITYGTPACMPIYIPYSRKYWRGIKFGSDHLSFLISLSLAENTTCHGISSPPWVKSLEYLCPLLTLQWIAPPLLKNSEQIRDTLWDKWPIATSSFLIATAYLSWLFVHSLSQDRTSPTAAD